MFYFGRIIGAFFNQLFRFLFWNKFGQKVLIIIIISLIAFWCLNMTEVHAVDEVSDVNYEVQSYYDSIAGDLIVRLENHKEDANISYFINNILKNNDYSIYFYYGNTDGSSYNNAKPVSASIINFVVYRKSTMTSSTPTSNDYMGVTGCTMYSCGLSYNVSVRKLNQEGAFSTTALSTWFMPEFAFTYIPQVWNDYLFYLRTDNQDAIIGLLEDIKEEQQATNDFLNEDTDTSNMVIDTPSVTDEASDNMSNNLHNQINTLTTDLQTTVNNYYEGWNAYTWSIPLPNYIGGNITFDSGVTRRIIGTSGVVYNIIQAIWVVLFGGYIVGFIKRMLDWVQTGKIFDEGGIADFIWWMDTNNEIIKASMM